MASSRSQARIVLNRAFFEAVDLAAADAMFALAKTVIDAAPVPDAAPYGEGLVQGGGVIAFVAKKRVGVYSKTGENVKKPRAAKLDSAGITVIGGYGFPGRFIESGTTKMGPRPWLTPTLMAAVPDAGDFVRLACVKRGITSSRRAAAGDTYQARRGGKP